MHRFTVTTFDLIRSIARNVLQGSEGGPRGISNKQKINPEAMRHMLLSGLARSSNQF